MQTKKHKNKQNKTNQTIKTNKKEKTYPFQMKNNIGLDTS